MKKKVLSLLLILTLAISTTCAIAFAETQGDSLQIKTVDQLKKTIANKMEDGNLSSAEKREITSNTTDQAIADLLGEKLDVAVEILNGKNMEPEMMLQKNGTEYAINRYDLGDDCELVVELQDQAEGVDRGTLKSSEVWKGYGNRYFTATASVKCNVGTVTLSLENHYTLSANGIDENYGNSRASGNNGKLLVVKGNPAISDGSARTPGGSDVNMYCKYTIKETSSSGKVTIVNSYKLNTTVKYLSMDKTGKRIKVGHAWRLTKV